MIKFFEDWLLDMIVWEECTDPYDIEQEDINEETDDSD